MVRAIGHVQSERESLSVRGSIHGAEFARSDSGPPPSPAARGQLEAR